MKLHQELWESLNAPPTHIDGEANLRFIGVGVAMWMKGVEMCIDCHVTSEPVDSLKTLPRGLSIQ